jgi:predicted Zn-dependent protease
LFLCPYKRFPGWPEGDPSLGSVGESNVWDMNGKYKGLKLQVLNNLDEGSDWHQYFETAMTDWDGGTPDAVSLYLRSSTYDADCRAVRKAMKVCNGNYGPTDWRGVNQILLQDEYIITSLAKMNDYYLEGTNMAQKQYTMCHELGHGLGLGHTDENFYNRDLGNCMDYTERPENNMVSFAILR